MNMIMIQIDTENSNFETTIRYNMNHGAYH